MPLHRNIATLSRNLVRHSSEVIDPYNGIQLDQGTYAQVVERFF